VLIIRKEQMDALSNYMLESFVNSMVAHLIEVWPERYQEMGELKVRESIYHAIDRAREAGIETEYDVERYIDLIYKFDWSTDEEPDAPWALEILNNTELDGSTKMDRLWEQAKVILAKET